MLTKNLASSDLIKQRQARTIYLNYISQQQAAQQGCAQRVQIQSGSGLDNASSQLIALAEGAIFTTVAQQQAQLSNTACPVIATAPAPAPVLPPLRLLILGDTNFSSLSTRLNTRLTALGYSGYSITSRQLGTTETGSDLTTANYNVLLMYTNSSHTGAAGLSANIVNFVNSGGHFVSGVFLWNQTPTGFDYTYTPYVSLASQSTDPNGAFSVDVIHPITNGVGTILPGTNATVLTNDNMSLQSGATKIATFTATSQPCVAIKILGSSRLVGINTWLANTGNWSNLTNLTTNACLWANGLI